MKGNRAASFNPIDRVTGLYQATLIASPVFLAPASPNGEDGVMFEQHQCIQPVVYSPPLHERPLKSPRLLIPHTIK
jgi:hypothetical protein